MASYVTSNQFNKITKAIENKTLFTQEDVSLNSKNIEKITGDLNKYSFVDFLTALSYKSPTITLTSDLGTNLIYEIGTSIPSCTLTASVTKGTSAIVSVEFFKDGNSVNVITTDVTNGGNFTHADGNVITTNTKYEVVVTCEDGTVVKEDLSINFYRAYYLGVVDKAIDDLLISDVKALTKEITAKEDKEYTFTSNNLYCTFAYPKEYGLITSIKDSNNFENVDSFNVREMGIDGVTYYVYQTVTRVICSGFKYYIEY